MAMTWGGFGTGFAKGLSMGTNLAKQFQEAQKMRAQEKLAQQMGAYMAQRDGAQTKPVDMSNPPATQIEPSAGSAAAPATSAPATPAASPVTPSTDTPSLSATLSDTGFGSGFNFLNGA